VLVLVVDAAAQRGREQQGDGQPGDHGRGIL
jgi:hypothetical protein